MWSLKDWAQKNKSVLPDSKRNAGMGRIKGYERKKEKQSPINRANFRAKLLRRRRDSDQSGAVHPGSVNTALSAFTLPSLLSLSLKSFKATHEAHIKAVMEYISSHCERWSFGRAQSRLTEGGEQKSQRFGTTIPFKGGSGRAESLYDWSLQTSPAAHSLAGP